MEKIKHNCFVRSECRKCPFEAAEGRQEDRYCLVSIEPALWDMDAIEKAYRKMEEHYDR